LQNIACAGRDAPKFIQNFPAVDTEGTDEITGAGGATDIPYATDAECNELMIII
jgi:hypothetical protein